MILMKMEYLETPNIQESNHKITFSKLKWLSIEKFNECITKNIEIHPNIKDRRGSKLSNIYFVGKTIQHNLQEKSLIQVGNCFKVEIIGTVLKNSETNEWQLNVSYNSKTFQVKTNFLILSIEDPECIDWITTNYNLIPKYALRASIDRLDLEYFHIGKICSQSELPTYFDGDECFNYSEREVIPHLFGKVNFEKCRLLVAFKNYELAFKNYEILCLKPTPASLKNLCRLKLRKIFGDSNKKIENINQNCFVQLSKSLIDFLKYPSYLLVGDCLLIGDKIVRKDGQYELLIEKDGKLVIKSINLCQESFNKESLVRVIKQDVYSIWLNRFQVCLYTTFSDVDLLQNFYNKSHEYVLTIDDKINPNYSIKSFNEI